MPFAYVQVLVFVGWMAFVERDPWPTLTLVVSLGAIFLSAFVMIGQNRQSAVQQCVPFILPLLGSLMVLSAAMVGFGAAI